MKIKAPLMPLIYSLYSLFFPALAGAADLDDISLDAVPNIFTNGTPADANDVNANFEFLRNNLSLLAGFLGESNLESRLAALEAALGTGNPGGVAGNTYLVTSVTNYIWANETVPIQGAGVAGGQAQWTFNSDGTGQASAVSCDGYRLDDSDLEGANVSAMLQIPACLQGTFTFVYTQAGSSLAVTSDANGGVTNFTVSDDGSALIGNVFVRTTAVPCPAQPDACTIQTAGIGSHAGVRIAAGGG